MIKEKRLSSYAATAVYVALLVLVPWSRLRAGGNFEDIENYLTRLALLQAYGTSYFEWQDSIRGWFNFEILWFSLLALAAERGIEPSILFTTLTAWSAFWYHRYLSRYIGGWLSVLILLNPIAIDLLSSQIRSAFAFSFIFILLILLEKLRKGWVATPILLLPFIHNAVAVVAPLLLFSHALARTRLLALEQKRVLAFAVAIGIAAALRIAGADLAQELGDRRAVLAESTKSAQYVLFWIVWACLLATSVRRSDAGSWRYYYAIIVCIFASASDIVGVPGFRFIALSIPIIFSTLPMLTTEGRKMATVIMPLYGALLFYYWI